MSDVIHVIKEVLGVLLVAAVFWLKIHLRAGWYRDEPLVNPKRFQTLFDNETDKKK
jgi:hypothetical protein